MAFVQVDRWDIAPASAGAAYPSSSQGWLAIPGLTGAIERAGRRALAVAASLLVHVLLLYLLISYVFGVESQPVSRTNGKAMIIVELSGPNPDERREDPNGDAQTPTPPASKAEATQTPIPPYAVEWALMRLPENPQTKSETIRPLTENASPASGGGDGGYDPFAGAAPTWPTEANPRGSGFAHGIMADPLAVPARANTQLLDASAFDALKRAVLAAEPTTRGTIEVEVKVAPNGTILEARIITSTISERPALFLKRYVIGRRLYQIWGTASQIESRRLPALTFR